MAGLPLRLSGFSVSLFSNAFLKGSIVRHVRRLDSTLTCTHSRSTSFISPYISRRYAFSSSDPGRNSKSGLGNIQNVNSTAHTEQMRVRQQLEEEQAKDEEQKTKDTAKAKKRALWGSLFLGGTMFLSGAYFLYLLALPPTDEEGNVLSDEFSLLPQPTRAIGRIKKGILFLRKIAVEPGRDKLLPDPLTYPYIQPPYTVVLDLTGLLVHPDWTMQTGWRFKKRPFVDNFLEQIAPPLFEVVVYTTEYAMSAYPILDALDQNGYIMYRLARDSTKYVDGNYVKCLDQLNRDLSKVIVVEWNPKIIKDNYRNVLFLPQWTGNDDDTTLIDLGAFLKTIAANKVEDVRDVLDYYQQFDDPIGAFRENQRKLLEQLEQSEKERKSSSQGLAQQWKPTFVKKPTL